MSEEDNVHFLWTVTEVQYLTVSEEETNQNDSNWENEHLTVLMKTKVNEQTVNNI